SQFDTIEIMLSPSEPTGLFQVLVMDSSSDRQLIYDTTAFDSTSSIIIADLRNPIYTDVGFSPLSATQIVIAVYVTANFPALNITVGDTVGLRSLVQST